MFIAWAVKSYFNWVDILPVQNYIGALLLFLSLEMAFHYGFWEDYNSRGEPSLALLVILAIGSAGRNALSFFLLLIVALGYGVVRPSLGSAMLHCKILAIVHFVCGALYAAGAMLTTPETAGLWVLVFVLPLSITTTTFYFWILNGLTNTMRLLETRKQHVKLTMYKRLWRILVFSVLLLGLFFLVNSASVANQDNPHWVSRRWRYRWFMLDGWLNLEYFLVFSLIAFLWRPTNQNQRYGLQELPSNEQEADDAFALDDDEDEDGVGFRVIGSGDGIKLGEIQHQREVGPGGVRPTGEAIFDIADDSEDEQDQPNASSSQARQQTGTSVDEEIEAESRTSTVVVRVDDNAK
jgi:hypothetical protein